MLEGEIMSDDMEQKMQEQIEGSLYEEAIAGAKRLERKNIIQGFIIWLLLCIIIILVMMP